MNHKYYELNKLIRAGENICIRIKKIYFPNTPWIKCYKRVGEGFTKLKIKGKKFFMLENKFELLKKLESLPNDDIKLLLENKNKSNREDFNVLPILP